MPLTAKRRPRKKREKTNLNILELCDKEVREALEGNIKIQKFMNAADRRYIGRVILRSRMGIYLRKAGLGDYKHWVNVYCAIPNIQFFKLMYFYYVGYMECKYGLPGEPKDYWWPAPARNSLCAYFSLLRVHTSHMQYYANKWRKSFSVKHDKVVRDHLMQVWEECQKAAPITKLDEIHKKRGEDKVLYYLGLGKTPSEVVQKREYFKRNKQDILSNTTSSAFTREMVLTYMSDDEIFTIFHMTKGDIESRAAKERRRLSRIITLARNYELLDDEDAWKRVEHLEHTPKFMRKLKDRARRHGTTWQYELNAIASISMKEIENDVMVLANQLAEIHGDINITNEANGIHLNMADPSLLVEDGAKELNSKHLAVNADMYLGTGKFNSINFPTEENKKYDRLRKWNKPIVCGLSMKTGERFTVEQLLAMAPIRDRGLDLKTYRPKVSSSSVSKRLVLDKFGELVPEYPEDVIPITELPEDHVAVQYLKDRGFNLKRLETMFDCCFCRRALPEDRTVGRYYGKQPDGFNHTPAGRILFSAMMNGSRMGWQGRIIDRMSPDKVYSVVHPTLQIYQKVHRVLFDNEILSLTPSPGHLKLRKYMNGVGSKRNELLMGYDAAVEYNRLLPYGERYCILVEGPLDAGRLGSPALAILGKSLSQHQLNSIRQNFQKVYTVMDTDEAGKQCRDKIDSMFEAIGRSSMLTHIPLPEGVKDAGDLTEEQANDLKKEYIHEYIRN